MSELTLDVGLAYKIKQARDRLSIPDNADLDWLAQGDNLLKIRDVRLDRAEIVRKSHLSAPTIVTLLAVKKPQRLAGHRDVRLFGCVLELFGLVKKRSEVPERTLERRDLEEQLDDFELVDELGGEDTAVSDSVEDLEAVIGQLIATKPRGRSGDLLKDGRANIFFVRDPQNSALVLCVDVRWLGVDRKWFVDSFPADAIRWDRGDRVFREVTAF